MAKIVISPELWIAITSLVKLGIELSGDYTEKELIQMAKDEELRSESLQKRQEEG